MKKQGGGRVKGALEFEEWLPAPFFHSANTSCMLVQKSLPDTPDHLPGIQHVCKFKERYQPPHPRPVNMIVDMLK